MSIQAKVGWRSFVANPVPASIVTSGLVLNLDAGNVSSYPGTGTTWTDLSGNNLNATLVNGTTYRTSYGGHLQFDGINDAAVLAYNTKLDPATAYRDLPFSINGWVKFDGAGGGTFMNKGDNGNASYETYTVSILPTGLQIILYNNASIYVTIKTTGITLNPGTWYNFATAYTGGYGTPDYQPNYNGTMKLYINGAECVTTVTITGSYIKMDPINTSTFIGSFGQVGAPGSAWAGSFNGSVAQTLMYNRQLTSTEVTQNYNATKTKFDLDTDAQAFLNAASITDSTQQSAINTLVTQLKTYGIWTKLKAVYPFVGGTVEQHRFNLKNPVIYKLTFGGGWAHSSTGALSNGTTGYADTQLSPSLVLSVNNTHTSIYVNNTALTYTSYPGFGCVDATDTTKTFYTILSLSNNYYSFIGDEKGSATYGVTYNNTDSKGFYLASRTSSTMLKGYKNNLLKATTTLQNTGTLPTPTYFYGGDNNGTAGLLSLTYNNYSHAFASIGDGLSDADATALYTAVQTYQTTLGRNVGAPIVADTDAQAFLNAAEITSQTQANAVNTLVTDLKSANIWTKMKALYPFVGGSASSHKFNLKDPRDLDAAYRLVFNGGWTHTGTGALPNGTTGYANTFFTPSSNFISNENAHISVYQSQPMAVSDMGGSFNSTSRTLFGANTTFIDCRLNSNETPVYVLSYNSDGKGLFITTKNGSSQVRAYRNNTLVGTITAQNSSNPLNMFISARNGNGTPNEYESTIQKFISFGDGLTDGEAVAFYNAVQKYQTSLGRQV